MEALKHLFKRKTDFVKSEDEEGNAPSDAQVAHFLRSLTRETGLALRGAPTAVRGTVIGMNFMCEFVHDLSVAAAADPFVDTKGPNLRSCHIFHTCQKQKARHFHPGVSSHLLVCANPKAGCLADRFVLLCREGRRRVHLEITSRMNISSCFSVVTKISSE